MRLALYESQCMRFVNIRSSQIKWFLCLVFIFACTLRILAVAYLMPDEQKIVTGDTVEYHGIALNIAQGKGYKFKEKPTALRGPIYPLFLGLVYKIFGQHLKAARVVQCIIGGLSVLITYWIATAMFNPGVGIIAALISTFYPPFLHYMNWSGPGYLLAETLFSFMTLLAVLCLVYYAQKQSLISMIASGVVLGLATLTKGALILLIPLLPFWILYVKKFSLKICVKESFIIIGFFLLTLSPWIIRNYVVFHELILVSTKEGGVFLAGNSPDAKGSAYIRSSKLENQIISRPELMSRYSEAELDRIRY